MRRRGLGVLLLAVLVGVAGGLGVGYLRQPQAATGGSATPLPAVSPSVPVDPPATTAAYAPDIDYPSLRPGLGFADVRMGNSVQAWRVPFPRGWTSYDLDDVVVPVKERSTYDELRFRPGGEPTEGGHSLRVKTTNTHLAAGLMVTTKLAALRDIPDADVVVLGRTEDSLKITFRDGTNRLRFNYFRWFAAPGSGEATLEMSVAGRETDVAGLDDLFAAFASTLRAVA
jgi:hypothetical protein